MHCTPISGYRACADVGSPDTFPWSHMVLLRNAELMGIFRRKRNLSIIPVKVSLFMAGAQE